jgi:hypothetical protein
VGENVNEGKEGEGEEGEEGEDELLEGQGNLREMADGE